MKADVSHSIGDLSADLLRIGRTSRRDMEKTVREGIRHGQREARAFARRSSGKHGQHYPRSITSEMKSGGGLGAFVGEWGPDPALPQGGMSFEFGSRKQPAHNDLGRSAALVVPAWVGEVKRLPDGWFW